MVAWKTFSLVTISLKRGAILNSSLQIFKVLVVNGNIYLSRYVFFYLGTRSLFHLFIPPPVKKAQ